MKIKVSIITVCLNSVETIERTIKSVLNQSYSNIEYIIIDGGSVDGTLDVIGKYKNRIDIIVSEADRGIYDAMNKGIKMASGEIIGMINSDDWYELGTIENVVRAFCSGNYEIVYGKINYVDKDLIYEYEHSPVELMWKRMTIAHPATFIKKATYEAKGLYRLDISIASDYDLILRYILAGVKVGFINRVLSNFSLNGLSRRELSSTIKQIDLVANQYFDYIYFGELLRDSVGDASSVIVWGAGNWGKRVIDSLRLIGMDVLAVIDRNRNKHGKYVKGIMITSDDILYNFDGCVIVAVEDYCDDISTYVSKQYKIDNNLRIDSLFQQYSSKIKKMINITEISV